ncbi:MAG: hypothetical protein KAU48_10055, partial [Candidatus Thorarchaeota archaeon]|nr:hypothetical protein [Candidatus Thorarchaeota archaeon]
RYIEDFVVAQLKNVDLKPWQNSCKSLAPPNYDNTTRSKWFEENKFRADVGRKVVEFVEEMVTTLREVDILSKIRVLDLKSAVVKGVRKAEQDQNITKYLLNDVKLATLRTIVGWVDHPERVKGDITDRSRKITRRGRKKEKGKYKPPQINLLKEWEIVSHDTIRITSAISNNYLHPYQNVELEVDFGPHLAVTSVSPFSWLPDEKRIRIGYLEAELGVEPLDTTFRTDLNIRKKVKTFTISGKVHFDNCDKGIQDVSRTSKISINLF